MRKLSLQHIKHFAQDTTKLQIFLLSFLGSSSVTSSFRNYVVLPQLEKEKYRRETENVFIPQNIQGRLSYEKKSFFYKNEYNNIIYDSR